MSIRKDVLCIDIDTRTEREEREARYNAKPFEFGEARRYRRSRDDYYGYWSYEMNKLKYQRTGLTEEEIQRARADIHLFNREARRANKLLSKELAFWSKIYRISFSEEEVERLKACSF